MSEALRHLRRVDPVMAQLIRRAGPYAVASERGVGPYEALVQAAAPTFARPAIQETDLLSINYTSGTTSRPKGVMSCRSCS